MTLTGHPLFLQSSPLFRIHRPNRHSNLSRRNWQCTASEDVQAALKRHHKSLTTHSISLPATTAPLVPPTVNVNKKPQKSNAAAIKRVVKQTKNTQSISPAVPSTNTNNNTNASKTEAAEVRSRPRRRRSSDSWVPPERILLAVNPNSERAVNALPVIAKHLSNFYGVKDLYVESSVYNSAIAKYAQKAEKSHVDDSVITPVDLIITLGGDGLILHVVSTLFPRAIPPIMPFSLGSLGFLGSFTVAKYKEMLKPIFQDTAPKVTSRMRLRCRVIRGNSGAKEKVKVGDSEIDKNCILNFRNDEMIEECGVEAIADNEFHVLNELVIDRGPAPYLSNLEVLCDNTMVTRVQADGLIIATPTGSTAYNLSAGGSMVHPDVPGILFTPICPHSLSFRPIMFPDYVTLTIKVPDNARANAWVCFDGKSRMELKRGDRVEVDVSKWMVETICRNDPTNDWFQSISNNLRWNERLMQGANDPSNTTIHLDDDELDADDDIGSEIGEDDEADEDTVTLL